MAFRKKTNVGKVLGGKLAQGLGMDDKLGLLRQVWVRVYGWRD